MHQAGVAHNCDDGVNLEGGLHGASGDAVAQGGVSDGRPGPPEGETPLRAQGVGVHDGSRRARRLWVIAPDLHKGCGARQGPATGAILSGCEGNTSPALSMTASGTARVRAPPCTKSFLKHSKDMALALHS